MDEYEVMAQQVELSFSTPHNFFMVVENLPEVEFTIQRAQIPTVSTEEAPISTATNPNKTFFPGEGVDYAPLTVDFIIDKHYKNYSSILEWIKACGHPDNFDQYANYVNNSNSIKNTSKFHKLFSTITIIGTDAGLTPLIDWTFRDCFPTDLDGPQFDSTLLDIEYLQSSATFRYSYFEFTTYTGGSRNDPI